MAIPDGPGRSGGAGAGGVEEPPRIPLLLHQIMVWLGTAIQLAITLSGWQGSAGSALRAYTVLLTLAVGSMAVGVVRWPATYWRNRHWLLPLGRISLYLAPSFRSAGVGSALMLERPPSPGWLGAAVDAFRVLSGTRLLGLIIGGLAIPQPPAVLAATQAVLLLCCQNNAGYCGTRLLADPLSGRRAQWLAVALDYLSLPVLAALEPALVQQGATHGHPGVPPSQACFATLSYAQLVLGVLLPTLAAARGWALPDDDAAADPTEPITLHAPGSPRHAQPMSSGPAAARAAPGKRLAAMGCKAVSAANSLLCYFVAGDAEAVAMLWWGLAFLWCQCRLAALRL